MWIQLSKTSVKNPKNSIRRGRRGTRLSLVIIQVLLLLLFWIQNGVGHNLGTKRTASAQIGTSTTSTSSTGGCPESCHCIWKDNKKTVECPNLQLTTIPQIGPDVQVLNLSNNTLKTLRSRIFQSMGLVHLQKIYLSRCKISSVEDGAFASVSNVVELDLSHNGIRSIPTNALKDCPIMSRLYLNNNPITHLHNISFIDLSSLRSLDLSHCQIESVEPNAFEGLKSLRHLHLDGNRLRDLSGLIIETLPSLYELNLQGNQWNCDCNLRDLRMLMVEQNIPLSFPPSCTEPPRLAGISWAKLELDEFACLPQVAAMDDNHYVYEGENATISCEVRSSPISTIEWQWKGRHIGNLSLMSFGKQMYLIKETAKVLSKTSTLYIMNAMEKDNGRYTCLASNKAGNVSADISLTVLRKELEPTADYSGEEVAGIVLGVLFVLLLIFLCVCFFVLRNKGTLVTTVLTEERQKTLSVNHNNYSTLERETGNCSTNTSRLTVSQNSEADKGNNGFATTVKMIPNSKGSDEERNCDEADCQTNEEKKKCLRGYSGNLYCNEDVNNRINSGNESENVSGSNNSLFGIQTMSSSNGVPDSRLLQGQESNFTLTGAVPTVLRNVQKDPSVDSSGGYENYLYNHNHHHQAPTTQHQQQQHVTWEDKSNFISRFSGTPGKDNRPDCVQNEKFSSPSSAKVHFATLGPRKSLESSELTEFYPPKDFLNKNGSSYATLRLPQKSLKGVKYSLRPTSGNSTWCRGVGGNVAALALEGNINGSPDEGLGDEKDYETDILD